MSSISRNSFVQDLLRNQGQIDLNNLSAATQTAFEENGINLDTLRRAAGTDGVISTYAELSALFSEVDRLDDNGNSNSIALQRPAAEGGLQLTPPGRVFAALQAEAGRQRDLQPYDRARFASELDSSHGTIDLENLTPRVQSALDALGFTREDLVAIAGPDHLIRGDEIGNLYDALAARQPLDQGFALRDAQGAFTPAGELFDALREHVAANRLLPRYQRPGGDAAAQTPLTVAANAMVVPEGERLPAVDLSVTGINQFSLYEDEEKGGKACYEAAVKQTVQFNAGEHGKTAPRLAGAGQAIQVAYAEDGEGRVEIDPTRAHLARDYIDRALDARLPVLVGVSYNDDAYNSDRLTDHFLTINGRDYDEQGRLYYTFRDPGDGGRAGRLYVDEATGKLFKEGDHLSHYVRSSDYELTQVRTYVGAP